MRLWGALLIAVVLAAGLAACKGTGPQEEAAPSPVLESPPPELSPQPDGEIREQAGGFRSYLHDVSLGQSNEQLGYTFRNYNAYTLPREPWSVAVHLDELSIGLHFNTNETAELDRLMKSVRIEPQVGHTVERSGQYAVYRFGELSGPFTITLGDLPPLRVHRAEPLSMQVSSESDLPSLVLHHEAGLHSTVYVTPEERSLLLTFSEPMDRSPNEQLPSGEWLSETVFRLHLDPQPIHELVHQVSTGSYLKHFAAESGNYLPYPQYELHLVTCREADWIDFRTGGKVGWSEYDPFYHTLLFAPDGSKYIGIVGLHGHETFVGESWSALVLEEKGTSPRILMTEWISYGYGIDWVDNDSFMYGEGGKLWLYDLHSGQSRVLHDTTDQGEYLNEAAYDRYEDQLYVITYTIKDAENGQVSYLMHRYMYDGMDRLRSRDPDYTEAPSEYWLHLPRAPVHPVSDGVYWTVYRDGQQATEYARRNGARAESPGLAAYADDSGALLLLEEWLDGEPYYRQTMYVWPDPLREPAAASAAPGAIMFSGQQPIAIGEQDHYLYDSASGTWNVWEKEGASVHWSGGRKSGMYRR